MRMFCDHTSKSTELYSHNNESSNNNNHINNNINNDNITSLLLINRIRVHFSSLNKLNGPVQIEQFVAIIHCLQYNMSWKKLLQGFVLFAEKWKKYKNIIILRCYIYQFQEEGEKFKNVQLKIVMCVEQKHFWSEEQFSF